MMPHNNGPSPSGPNKMNFDKEQAKEQVKNHFQNKVMVVDDVDRQVWELVSNVPYVSKPVAVVTGVVNLIFPGFGTLIASCAGSDTVSKTQMTISLL